MKLRFSIALSLVFVLVACNSGTRPPRIGSEAPDFTVADSDRTVKLSDLRGKTVLLNFWATWCAPCVAEMPSLVQLQSRMKDKVTVVAVSLDIDENAYRNFTRTRTQGLLTVRDANQKSNSLYGTYKFPETYVIDRNGVVRRKFIGAVDWNSAEVQQYLESL